MKHCPGTNAVPDSWVRGIQNRWHFLCGEVPDKPGISFFRGDGQNALDLFKRRGQSIFHIVHERLDGREPDISGTSAVLGNLSQGNDINLGVDFRSRNRTVPENTSDLL